MAAQPFDTGFNEVAGVVQCHFTHCIACRTLRIAQQSADGFYLNRSNVAICSRQLLLQASPIT